ncbi:HNH endonuclease [Ornithinimicrobium tianjinense]|uniref:HNH nuclease domain-containing protein n=1 Tax=Ornithinimicrobium tianjinense TaxID=1195761 RepID=A0A917F149_9MICO|nr:HNH endonuclease signature motif containing protein [Ornithinimicrobium tianjinense]GGF40006.1 hypothetical protein GCM10011366_04510 [Ornithinimicrobium tianjinense]
MTSWVVTIDRQHPGHWAIAKEHGFWDLTRGRAIAAGDLVYFWQAGKSFLAQTRATSDAMPLEPGSTASWEDSGTRSYAARFEFEVISESPLAQPKWIIDVGPQLTGKVPDLRSIPSFDHPDDERLASYFAASPLEVVLAELLLESPDEPSEEVVRLDLSILDEDQRKVVEQIVAIREGQSEFRQSLLKVYDGCAVTGTRFEASLDAAHISPYKGLQSNKVRNGLILRKDVHRLFDLDLLALEDDGTIRVAPEVTEPIYRELDGNTAHFPSDPTSRPDPAVLAAHRAKCTWLPPAAAGPAAVTDEHVLF